MRLGAAATSRGARARAAGASPAPAEVVQHQVDEARFEPEPGDLRRRFDRVAVSSRSSIGPSSTVALRDRGREAGIAAQCP